MCHVKTDFLLVCLSAVEYSADLAVAEDEDAVRKLEQYVEVLADVNYSDALFFLLVYKVIYSIRRIYIKSADSVSSEQYCRRRRDFTSYEHLLNVTA